MAVLVDINHPAVKDHASWLQKAKRCGRWPLSRADLMD